MAHYPFYEEINDNYIEVLENSMPYDMGQEDIGGTHKKNSIDGFDTRKTIIADEDGAFDLELTIAILESGEKVAYAKKYVAPNKDVTEKIQANERISSSHLDQMPDGNKIAQKDGTVKQRYSESEDEAAQKAIEHFGKTYKWSETGYITKDGSRLDFSGRHEGAPGGTMKM